MGMQVYGFVFFDAGSFAEYVRREGFDTFTLSVEGVLSAENIPLHVQKIETRSFFCKVPGAGREVRLNHVTLECEEFDINLNAIVKIEAVTFGLDDCVTFGFYGLTSGESEVCTITASRSHAGTE